jgi:putative DNA primase/helicase
MAAKLNAVLLGVTHYTKGTQRADPLERVTGSLAFGALARLVFGTAKQRDVAGRFVFMRVKSNVGEDGSGFVYEFEQAEVDEVQHIMANRIHWGDAIQGDARDAINAAEADPAEGGGSEVTTFLRELLRAGPVASGDVYKQADAAGFTRDQIKRAKKVMGTEVVAEKELGVAHGPWRWRLDDGKF